MDFGKPPDEDLLPNCRVAVVVMMAARMVYKFDFESFPIAYGFEQLDGSQPELEQKSKLPSVNMPNSSLTSSKYFYRILNCKDSSFPRNTLRGKPCFG